YEEVLKAILDGDVNGYLEGFTTLSIAEQQKQQKARYRMERMNSFFFGQAIDVNNQTPETWRDLPTVHDVINTECPIEYKANALGVFTMLQECNRVRDYQGGRLNLNSIFNDLYELW